MPPAQEVLQENILLCNFEHGGLFIQDIPPSSCIHNPHVNPNDKDCSRKTVCALVFVREKFHVWRERKKNLVYVDLLSFIKGSLINLICHQSLSITCMHRWSCSKHSFTLLCLGLHYSIWSVRRSYSAELAIFNCIILLHSTPWSDLIQGKGGTAAKRSYLLIVR